MRIVGALHLHSSYSYDAKLSLRELRELFIGAGLSFACMTEHTDEMTHERAVAFIDECKALSDDRFLFIPGFEVSFFDTHILLLGAKTFITQHATREELIAWRREAALGILAHPHRNRYRTTHIPSGVLDGIEIWNAQYDGKLVPRNGARRFFARFSKTTPSLMAFAGWDLHRSAHAGGPVIAFVAPSLSHDTVLSALSSGAYTLDSSYISISSTGIVERGSERAARLMSSFFVFSIRAMKAMNRVLSWCGLRLPRGLVASIRRKF